MNKRVFTLVELLVVIGIVAVLAAMLLPTLGKVQEKARMTECLGQLRQIGIAIAGYAGENNDRLPACSRLAPTTLSPFPSLREQLASHLDTADVFCCPSDRGAAALYPEFGTSYEWNTFLNGKCIDRATMRVIGLEVVAPLLGDAELFHGSFGRNYLHSDGRVTRSLELLIHED